MRSLLRRSTDLPNDPAFTWNPPSPLAGRLEVPSAHGWERMQASESSRQILADSFSTEVVAAGGVIGLAGPQMTSKSQAALALCDLRGLRPVYATEAQDQQAFVPAPGLCIIIDPVSAHREQDVASCVEYYRGHCPVILIDRDPALLARIPHVQQVIKRKLPNPQTITSYLNQLLNGDGDAHRRSYPNTLTASDLDQLGKAMHGLNLPQINQIAMDAVLRQLQHDRPIDRRSFDMAMSAAASMRQSQKEAAYRRGGKR